MNQEVTLKDVAARVGKSVSAVSKALSGAPDIGPKTHEAVHRAAAELGYEPHAAAKQLKLQRTDTVGLILPAGADLRISDPFFAEFLTGLTQRLAGYGLDVLLSTSADEDDEAAHLRQIRARRVDGFVVVRTRRGDRRLQVLAERGIPYVAFGRSGDADTAYVDEDGAAAMSVVVGHLTGLGHTDLVCIAEPTGYAKAHNRVEGFLAGLDAYGFAATPDSVVVAGYRQDAGYEAARRILAGSRPATAIVCSNDLLALGAMRAAQEAGLIVGKDVSITGFDDIALAADANPPLTTVRNAAHDSGCTAADIVGGTIRGLPMEQTQVLLDLEFVIRDSTGPPRTTGGMP